MWWVPVTLTDVQPVHEGDFLMTDLLAARAQMAMSLAFHIIFAAVGIAMPLLMVICRRAVAQDAGGSLPDAGEAVGKRHCYYVRCWSSFRHRSVF